MAFPYITENGFEDGTRGHFDSEADATNRLDFPHYSELARLPAHVGMPWRGAYCMRVDLSLPFVGHNRVIESAWATAAGGSIFVRLMFRVSSDLAMSNGNEFGLVYLRNNLGVPQAGAFVNFTTANGVRLGIGKASATSFAPLTLGVWHCLELRAVIDSGAGNDGTLDAWLDGVALTQVTGLDQGAVVDGAVGVSDQNSGTTRGTVLFDDIIADEARIFPPVERFPEQLILTASGHVFVGQGELAQVELLSGAATDNVLSVFDTDRAYTSDASSAVLELKNTANNERVASDAPVCVHRGAYVALSGTNPRAMVKIGWANSYDDGAMRNLGLSRKVNVLAGG